MNAPHIVPAYPLTWPAKQPRTSSRRSSPFKTSTGQALAALLRELRLLRAIDIVVSSNVPIRRDGLMHTSLAEPIDPGVAVYFDRIRIVDGRTIRTPFVLACDAYRRVRENVRAIGLTVEALRAIQRHGATEMLEQAFTGFAALPPASRGSAWTDVLGLPETATPEQIKASHRELARIHHPDVGGDATRMAEINAARDAALISRGLGHQDAAAVQGRYGR